MNTQQMQMQQIQSMMSQLTSLMSQVNNMPAQEAQPSAVPAALPAPSAALKTIRTCHGIEEAKEAQRKLNPGESEIVMDDSESIFYAITKDKEGKSPRKMMVGHFTMEEEPEPPKYITQTDLEAFKTDFEAFKADLLNAIKGGDKA